MMAVAIVGMLASMAIPTYGRFAGRARQTEAKFALSSMYQAEQTVFAAEGSYTDCILEAGFVPASSRRYYLTGVWIGDPGDCGPDGRSPCYATAWDPISPCFCDCNVPLNNSCNWAATEKVSVDAVILDDCPKGDAIPLPRDWSAHQSSFKVGAAGNISSDPIYDIWEIDERKNMTNLSSGL
jgi:type II secretory pathway pseudopilin PulG